MLAGGRLTKMLNARVAYHHSGMSYALRAGIVEPLAKNGHLRVVVATMGLAAGINFSMRSVVVTDTRYLAGNFEREVQPDELLHEAGEEFLVADRSRAVGLAAFGVNRHEVDVG